METSAVGGTTFEKAGSLSSKQRKAVVAATLGSVVEYTDWVIYATFAPFFSKQFFPSSVESVSLLSTLAVFAVGFVMRPVGGAVLGAYADRKGRKKGLAFSVLLMAGSSLLIAICPAYDVIGFAAPILLLLARLVQGFAAGGEFGSASTFLIESAAPSLRAFVGSWQHFAVNAGVLISALIGIALTTVFGPANMAAWGWRIGFAIAGLMGGVALWVRLAVNETDVFAREVERKQNSRHPAIELIRVHPRAALRVIGIAMAGNLAIYEWLAFFPAFAHAKAKLPLHDGFVVNLISIGASLVAIPFIGRLADRVGRKPVLLVFAGSSALYAWPSLHYLTADFWTATVIATIGMLLSSGFAATCAAVMAEQFPAAVRATGVALPYAISAAVFGGTLPYFMVYMLHSGASDFIWIYVAGVSLFGFAVYAAMPETRGKVLD